MPCALYGVPDSDIDAVAERLGGVLGLEFGRRDSGYWGPYALHEEPGGGEVRIYHNDDPMHDPDSSPPGEQFFEPGHPDLRVLVSARLLSADRLRRLGAAIESEFPGSTLGAPKADPVVGCPPILPGRALPRPQRRRERGLTCLRPRPGAPRR
jgi:hypothetical protein